MPVLKASSLNGRPVHIQAMITQQIHTGVRGDRRVQDVMSVHGQRLLTTRRYDHWYGI